MPKLRKRNGFTLIELLVVVSIIGIFSSVSTIGALEVRETARDATRYKELESLATALELYYTDHGEYPADEQGFCNTSAGNIAQCPPYGGLNRNHEFTLSEDWSASLPLHSLVSEMYISKLPVDPLNRDGYWYVYRSTEDKQGYVLFAIKEQGGGMLKIGGSNGKRAWYDYTNLNGLTALDTARIAQTCSQLFNTVEENAENGCDEIMDYNCDGIFTDDEDLEMVQRWIVRLDWDRKYCPPFHNI